VERRHARADEDGPESPYDADRLPFVARVLAAHGITLEPEGERLTRP